MSDATTSCWSVIDAVIPVCERLLLSGPPATGKTTVAILAAQRTGRSVYTITCTTDLPAFEARGTYHVRDGSMHWNDGPAIAAMRNGGVLVIDEIDKASSDLLAFLLSITATGDAATITLPTGEVLKYNPALTVVCTMNGDPLEILPEPLLSRFPVRIAVNETAPEAIAALPADLQNHAQATCDIEDERRRIDVRAWRAFAMLRDKVGEALAAQAVWGERAHTVLDSIRMAATGAPVTDAECEASMESTTYDCGCERGCTCGDCADCRDDD